MKTIVLDCLGADKSQEEIAMGAILSQDLDVNFTLIGDKERLTALLKEHNADLSRFDLIHSEKTIENGMDPRLVLRGGEDTSVHLGLKEAAKEDSIAFLSAGNTGAVLVGSIFLIGLLPNIKFPALGCNLLSKTGKWFCLLDCGANLDVTPAQMEKFAKIGHAVAEAFYKIPSPRIGLLNVGKEEGKGNALMKETYGLLKESGLNFVGNIEGNALIMDKADVVVCDGFSGNVALKALESAALFSRQIVLESATGEGAKKAAAEIHAHFGYTDLGASIVYGCRKIVMKPHGSASRDTIKACIKIAYDMDQGHVIEGIESILSK